MPIDRDPAKDDAESAVRYFRRLEAKGLTEQQCRELTVAWILSRRVDAERDAAERKPWEG